MRDSSITSGQSAQLIDSDTSSLSERLHAGAPFAVTFGGQGSDWLRSLSHVVSEHASHSRLTELVERSTRFLAPVAGELAPAMPRPFAPQAWLASAQQTDTHSIDTQQAGLAVPGVLLAQLLTLDLLAEEGLDLTRSVPRAVAGHSQGILAMAAYAARRRAKGQEDPDTDTDAVLLTMARLIGAAASTVARRTGLLGSAGAPVMLSVSGVPVVEVADLVTNVAEGLDPDAADTPHLGVVNGSRACVVSGSPAALARVRRAVAVRAEAEAEELSRKQRGGRAFAPALDEVATTVAFHHPALTPAVALARDWAERCQLDAELAENLAREICSEPVDWPEQLADVIAAEVDLVIDLGPAHLSAGLTKRGLRGRGVRVVAAGTETGREQLFTPGAAPDPAPDWSAYAPRLLDLGDGRLRVDTAFTRATGCSPVLLAGMTPTTVDPAIVAAAANAGHWAELAGGGQVTEDVWAESVDRLAELLGEGRTAQLNALYLDPYLWRLQVGGRRLLQRARAAGAPIDGLVVSAGIPEIDEAVALIEELAEAGIAHVAFKPGTVAQVRQVVAIAEAVDSRVIVHLEGGAAGGHHSWEDLDELLLATYADLRSVPGLVLCVGGGIGTPEAAARYLSGTWSIEHAEPAMPLDGVLIGTAAMACAEATTSPAVKELLVRTPGVSTVRPGGRAGWVGLNRHDGGITSGRSQLGADLHELFNASARCGALLDEVAGDAEAVSARAEELVAAMEVTAKPFFGDAGAMTYHQLLERFVDLTHRRPTGWIDHTFASRFAVLLDRAVARLHEADRGEIERVDLGAPGADGRIDPAAALDALVSAHPEATQCPLHPADVHFFREICGRVGKPVPFVPVLDADVRRWWRSDSLWQSHDATYGADSVSIIPGPVSIAGIERVDEPIGTLLDRFEKGAVDRLLDAGAEVIEGVTRTAIGEGATLLDAFAEAPDVVWAGRTIRNPLTRLTGVRHTVTAEGDAGAVLEVPLDRGSMRVGFDLSGLPAGGLPVVADDAARDGIAALLELTAGGALPATALDGDGRVTATTTVAWDPHLIADHAAVTGSLGGLAGDGVPDVLVGLAWPAIFAAIGPVEGLLDLVHLDHLAELAAGTDGSPPWTRLGADEHVTVTATRAAEQTTVAGTVITVVVCLALHDGRVIADLTERFVVRGRTGAASGVRAADVADPPVLAEQSAFADREHVLLHRAAVTAPEDLTGFAAVTGDHNPLHTEVAAARLAGFDGPIVHGMWLSALAQRALGRPVTAWRARWVAPVLPGAEVELSVVRTGVHAGALLVEVTARVEGETVMAAEGVVQAPRTAYAFPGQGIQRQGMGLDARARSAAARSVWDEADAFTRESLGFSILAVVRDNPTELLADGGVHRHPDGVLFLTQFTQVAMATLAVAQVAELREAGVFVEDAVTCGHSVGEYNALAAVTGTLPLSSLLEIVFRRGMAMHALVPRDDEGRSDYRLAAIRPSQAGISDDEVTVVVEQVAGRCGEFLQVVNFNLRGSQYAVAGTVAALKALEAELDERRARIGGKAAFVLVPGIDVPFHSAVLRDGVPEFRTRLDALVPAQIDVDRLVGRYIPNLVPRLFSLEQDFVAEVARVVPSDVLESVITEWEVWSADPQRLGRTLLIELLAWQFASPVRWIETQDLLFVELSAGGLGIERFIEVGVAESPTLANLAAKTVALVGGGLAGGADVQILNCSRDVSTVMATDKPSVEDTLPHGAERAQNPPERAQNPPERAQSPAERAQKSAESAEPPARSGGSAEGVEDLAFDAADATRLLVALRTSVRPDQVAGAETIEGLTDGVSSRRNQLLVDLGTELGLGAVDGAAEAEWDTLATTVAKAARGYRPFGPVLSESVDDALRRLTGTHGVRPAAVADRVTEVWRLGHGWAAHVRAQLAAGLRDGDSLRGGDLGFADVVRNSDLDALIDHAVETVASTRGVTVSLPAAESDGAGASVDAGALAALTAGISGPDGVLAGTARDLLRRLGLGGHLADHGVSEAEPIENLEPSLQALVEAELGSDWPRKIAPRFDARRAVLLDDRWASAREDLARAWTGQDSLEHLAGRSWAGLDEAARTQIRWWLDRSRREHRSDLVQFYGRVLSEAEDTTPGAWAGEVAVVTGAAPGSIASAVVADLLRGGATVVATASTVDSERLGFFKQLVRDHARAGAALWAVPANLAAFSDIDALVDWVGGPVAETAGGASTEVRPGLTPSLLLPFAAPAVRGTADQVGPGVEIESRVLLWGVERLIVGLSRLGADHRVGSRLHVVLPGSPNRGRFGGDGAYGEVKAAFDAFVQRWHAESDWAGRVSLAHALIGWTRGTGLMGHHDRLVAAVTEAGVRTWGAGEMAEELLALCTPSARREAGSAPIVKDLTGGLGEADLDLAALAREAAAAAPAAAATVTEDEDEETDGALMALTHPAGWRTEQPIMPWPQTDAKPEDLVVIVAGGEVGPVGSARTRFELEVDDELSPAGVLELAWTTGLVVWESDGTPGWSDATTGDRLTESEVVERFTEQVTASVGIRAFRDDHALVDGTAPLAVPVHLEADTSFLVRSREEAHALLAADPGHTRVAPVDDRDDGNGGVEKDGDWRVTRLAGAEIRVLRRFRLSRFVGAQLPDGFDPAVYGLGSMTSTADRLAAWNLVATVDAFVSAGLTPADLLRWVHPTRVANTQGTGIGGMQSTRRMYVDALLGEDPPRDVLQEALPNVVAAHAVQAYIGSYGAMVHPVAACATAAVSVEEAVDKIRVGKADVVVAGGFDDLGLEGIIGFGAMGATADTAEMLDKGIAERHVCRPNDRRRAGFVEGAGGGTVVLARGDVALRAGLPVLGVVAYAASFGDGIHTSIPAPGLGALGAAVGGSDSPLARGLATVGLVADDVAVVSKHDTSTAANDPNESRLHEGLAQALGRTPGNPLHVVSQKSLTGHAKGGAAAFQINGLCQLLQAGLVPPNRGLDCVDPTLAENPHLVWLRETLRTGPLRAGLVTSLGFGHVSAVLALAHPGAFAATLTATERKAWLRAATQRLTQGQARRQEAMHGGRPMYERPEQRRFASTQPAAVAAEERAMLADADARLGPDGRYARTGVDR